MTVFVACVAVSCFLAVLLGLSGKFAQEPEVVQGYRRAGVPVSWLPWLAVGEYAYAFGLVVGLIVAPMAIVASVILVVHFLGMTPNARGGDLRGVSRPSALAVLSVTVFLLRVVTI